MYHRIQRKIPFRSSKQPERTVAPWKVLTDTCAFALNSGVVLPNALVASTSNSLSLLTSDTT